MLSRREKGKGREIVDLGALTRDDEDLSIAENVKEGTMTTGCYTCRIHQRTCDLAQPHCSACLQLKPITHISPPCDYSGVGLPTPSSDKVGAKVVAQTPEELRTQRLARLKKLEDRVKQFERALGGKEPGTSEDTPAASASLLESEKRGGGGERRPPNDVVPRVQMPPAPVLHPLPLSSDTLSRVSTRESGSNSSHGSGSKGAAQSSRPSSRSSLSSQSSSASAQIPNTTLTSATSSRVVPSGGLTPQQQIFVDAGIFESPEATLEAMLASGSVNAGGGSFGADNRRGETASGLESLKSHRLANLFTGSSSSSGSPSPFAPSGSTISGWSSNSTRPSTSNNDPVLKQVGSEAIFPHPISSYSADIPTESSWASLDTSRPPHSPTAASTSHSTLSDPLYSPQLYLHDHFDPSTFSFHTNPDATNNYYPPFITTPTGTGSSISFPQMESHSYLSTSNPTRISPTDISRNVPYDGKSLPSEQSVFNYWPYTSRSPPQGSRLQPAPLPGEEGVGLRGTGHDDPSTLFGAESRLEGQSSGTGDFHQWFGDAGVPVGGSADDGEPLAKRRREW